MVIFLMFMCFVWFVAFAWLEFTPTGKIVCTLADAASHSVMKEQK